MKIGIFGGCFNPPHKMHKAICDELLKRKIVDKIIIVPVGELYEKSELASNIDRYNMLDILFNDNNKVEISKFEFQDKQVYTYQTLLHFNEKEPQNEICFICGVDNLNEIATWKEFYTVIKDFRIIAVKRAGTRLNCEYKNLILQGFKIEVVDINSERISSTAIRLWLKNNNIENLQKYIDEKVLKYLLNSGTYQQ